MEAYTNVVIGSGEGGKYLASHLASSGEKTAVVERRWIGGSCPNINCFPAKNEIHSAKVAYLAARGPGFGVHSGHLVALFELPYVAPDFLDDSGHIKPENDRKQFVRIVQSLLVCDT